MKIAYVCTNYNNSDYTIAAVDSLRKNIGHEIFVVVVDNASRSEEIDKLDSIQGDETLKVHIIKSLDNVGYFRGLNFGLDYVRCNYKGVDWVVAGNNDLEFKADFCNTIQCKIDDLAKYPVISPDIVTLDGEHQNPQVINGISFVREIFYDLYHSNYHLGLLVYKLAKALPIISDRADELEWRVARTIYQGHGACYLLTPRFWSLFERFWAPTFMMAEEFFLSKQLIDAGEKIYYEPTITVMHRWHGSLDNIPSRRRWEMSRDAHFEYRKYINISNKFKL